MRKRTKLFLSLGVAFVLSAVICVVCLQTRELYYEGAPLSHWVEVLGTPLSPIVPVAATPLSNAQFGAVKLKHFSAQEAVRHLGTNAIPFLLKWASYEEPRWIPTARKLIKKVPILCRVLDRRSDRANGTGPALAILRPDIVPALPEMVRIATNTTHPAAAHRMKDCLLDIAFEADSIEDLDRYSAIFPTLTNAVADTSLSFQKRFRVAHLLSAPSRVIPQGR